MLFKPLGFKKDGNNFRLIQNDGLCKIINFQRSLYNTKDNIGFTINLGIYFEKETEIQNKKFKEYASQIRTRLDCDWWYVNSESDIEETYLEIEKFIKNDVFKFFDIFNSKNLLIEMILSGESKKYSDVNVLNYNTAKLLVEMGFGEKVLPLIEKEKALYLQELAKEIKCKESKQGSGL